MKKYPAQQNKGFTLFEMIIYIAVIGMMFAVTIHTIVSFTRSYRHLAVLRSLDRSAVTILERMTRDIRNANSVDTGQSVFVSSPGTLAVVQTSGGLSTTTRYYTQSGQMRLDENGSYVGPLTLNNTLVSSLVFQQMTGTTTAIRIDLTLQSTSGGVTRTKPFHATVILKGS
ncbi:MAG: prepilin-type N-terminal cleavage/methylation domain-containing protein [bacterium]|nr:prepilin-type N-terminal cleavage/methylation domain-containing protein [bacterium]